MRARMQVLLAAVCFGTTGTAQALGPSASPVAVGAARIVLGGSLLAAIAAAMGVRRARTSVTVLSKRLIDAGEAPEGVMAAGFGGAAILLVPVLAAAGPGFLTGAGGLALALYLGAVPTALAYVLFARGLRSLTAGETATLTLAEPLTATVLGAGVAAAEARA